jgi:hypothetical protein
LRMKNMNEPVFSHSTSNSVGSTVLNQNKRKVVSHLE